VHMVRRRRVRGSRRERRLVHHGRVKPYARRPCRAAKIAARRAEKARPRRRR
jgi:hypothetical protein